MHVIFQRIFPQTRGCHQYSLQVSQSMSCCIRIPTLSKPSNPPRSLQWRTPLGPALRQLLLSMFCRSWSQIFWQSCVMNLRQAVPNSSWFGEVTWSVNKCSLFFFNSTLSAFQISERGMRCYITCSLTRLEEADMLLFTVHTDAISPYT